jgi:hypothetical protein
MVKAIFLDSEQDLLDELVRSHARALKRDEMGRCPRGSFGAAP